MRTALWMRMAHRSEALWCCSKSILATALSLAWSQWKSGKWRIQKTLKFELGSCILTLDLFLYVCDGWAGRTTGIHHPTVFAQTVLLAHRRLRPSLGSAFPTHGNRLTPPKSEHGVNVCKNRKPQKMNYLCSQPFILSLHYKETYSTRT